MKPGARKADRVLQERARLRRLSEDAASDEAVRISDAEFEVLKEGIVRIIPRVLHQLEAKGYPDGDLITFERRRPFGLGYKRDSVAAWRVYFKLFRGEFGEMGQGEGIWLVSNGELVSNGGPVDVEEWRPRNGFNKGNKVFDNTSNSERLRGVLKGLQGLESLLNRIG